MKKLIVSCLVALVLVATMTAPAIAADSDETSVGATVSVNEYVSISYTGSIVFTDVDPGETDVEADSSPAIVITVESETNVYVDIGIKGSDTDGIDLANWKYSTTLDPTKESLTGSYVPEYTNVGDGTYNFYHFIDVPADTSAGDYHVIVWYKAVVNGALF